MFFWRFYKNQKTAGLQYEFQSKLRCFSFLEKHEIWLHSRLKHENLILMVFFDDSRYFGIVQLRFCQKQEAAWQKHRFTLLKMFIFGILLKTKRPRVYNMNLDQNSNVSFFLKNTKFGSVVGKNTKIWFYCFFWWF